MRIYNAEESVARREAQRPTKCERCGAIVRLQLEVPGVHGTDWWHREPDITHDDFKAGRAGQSDVMYAFELVDDEVVEGCWRRHTPQHCAFFRRTEGEDVA